MVELLLSVWLFSFLVVWVLSGTLLFLTHQEHRILPSHIAHTIRDGTPAEIAWVLLPFFGPPLWPVLLPALVAYHVVRAVGLVGGAVVERTTREISEARERRYLRLANADMEGGLSLAPLPGPPPPRVTARNLVSEGKVLVVHDLTLFRPIEIPGEGA